LKCVIHVINRALKTNVIKDKIKNITIISPSNKYSDYSSAIDLIESKKIIKLIKGPVEIPDYVDENTIVFCSKGRILAEMMLLNAMPISLPQNHREESHYSEYKEILKNFCYEGVAIDDIESTKRFSFEVLNKWINNPKFKKKTKSEINELHIGSKLDDLANKVVRVFDN